MSELLELSIFVMVGVSALLPVVLAGDYFYAQYLERVKRAYEQEYK